MASRLAVSKHDLDAPGAGRVREPQLALLDPGQHEAATRVLAAAFRDNPLNRAVIGESARRRLRCNLLGSRASLEVAIGHSWCRAVCDAGEIRGVLVAHAPGSRPLPLPSIGTQLRCLWGQGLGVARGWNRAHFELERLHPTDSHWYLDLVGVDPAFQRCGVGGALVRNWLAQVDADEAPSYLETDRRENVVFYERAGFGILSEDEVVGVRVWRMWRRARQAAEKTVGGSDVR